MAGNLKLLSVFSQIFNKDHYFRHFGPCILKNNRQWISYIQGQSPEPNRREYFYYIDHNGMLFLDDARMKNFTSCFKEKKFLAFFFQRLRRNDTGLYEEDFPYFSPCGRERNYIRCDDTPIVFTYVINKPEGEFFCHNHAGDVLSQPFQPSHIHMSLTTGRLYHPTSSQYGDHALIQSKTAIELSQLFRFRNGEEAGPTHIIWGEKEIELNNDWIQGVKLNTEFPSEQI